MPCLNEGKTLGNCIRKAERFFSEHGVSGEVVIADNGSTDGSQSLALGLGARLVSVTERGYGAALMGGIQEARGQYIVMGDADESYDFGSLLPFLEKLREGYGLVMGNRFAGGIEKGAMPPLHRFLGNPVLSRLGRLFFRSPCSDFHCGLRGFSRSAIESLDLRTTGMEFASEMVVKASLKGLRIAEVPTTLSRDGRGRPSHLRTWRDGWRHLRFLLLYSPRWLFLYPGLLLMFTGLLITLALIPGPREIGGVVFDVHTLLYGGMFIVLGFEAVFFAIYTKVFAITEGLLPEDRRLGAVFRYVKVETGLIAGGAMILGGIAGSLYATESWGARSFGPLDPTQTLRIVIPSSILLVLGGQIVLSGFFVSILGMKRK